MKRKVFILFLIALFPLMISGCASVCEQVSSATELDAPDNGYFEMRIDLFRSIYEGILAPCNVHELPILQHSVSGDNYQIAHKTYVITDIPQKQIASAAACGWQLDLSLLHPVGFINAEKGYVVYSENHTVASNEFLLLVDNQTETMIWLLQENSTLLDIHNYREHEFLVYQDEMPVDDLYFAEEVLEHHLSKTFNNIPIILDGEDYLHSIRLTPKNCQALSYLINYYLIGDTFYLWTIHNQTSE